MPINRHRLRYVEERFWDGKWTRETRSTAYNADGCRVDFVVSEASDFTVPITNSVTTYDFLERVASVQTPAFGGGWLTASNFYDGTSSRVLRSTRTGQLDTLYQYDALGNLTATALDVDGDGQIDYAGADRISTSETRHALISGDWWRVTTQSIWAEDGVNTCLTTGVSRVRLTGFGWWDDTYGGSLVSQNETRDTRGHVTRSSTYADAAQAVATQVTKMPDSIIPAVTHVVAGHAVLQASATAVTNSMAYDGFARRTAFTDGRGNTTVTHYNALGQADYTEDAAANRTTYGYDALGRQASVTDALTNTVHTAYDSLGNAVSVWGATYPVENDHDTQGRKVSMKTFRDEEGSGDETRWFYDNATGLMTNKIYADGQGPSYTYTPGGKLNSRTWTRGVTTGYSYDYAGSLVGVDYSDSTPDVDFTHDRLGRMISATSTVTTNLFTYDGLNLATETQNGVTINRTTDNLGRQAGFGLGTDYVVQYGYDAYGRFSAVTSSVRSMRPRSGKSVSSVVQYSYISGTSLLTAMTNSVGFSWTRAFEPHRDLLASVENRFGANLVSRFDYDNDSLARRTRRVDNLAVTNDFGYNTRSEVIGAQMGTNQYSYAYDPIGNRLTATNNADGWVYLTNPLNQYTNILRASAPPREDAPTYDLDGNMTATGDGWVYVWNGENRMILASNAEHVVTYAYDHQGRMVGKTVDEVACQYLWDGYNIVAGVGTVATNWFIWGLDLSGTLQGAGGVGGLLAEIQDGQPYFAGFDANGNVTEYVATNGVTAAHYEYSPFGEITCQSGDLADSFTHRFSTKPWCAVTGLSEYEYRKYGPGMGRWRSKDPIEENGGACLYICCFNSGRSNRDYLGTLVFFVYFAGDSLTLGSHEGSDKPFDGFMSYLMKLLETKHPKHTFQRGTAGKAGAGFLDIESDLKSFAVPENCERVLVTYLAGVNHINPAGNTKEMEARGTEIFSAWVAQRNSIVERLTSAKPTRRSLVMGLTIPSVDELTYEHSPWRKNYMIDIINRKILAEGYSVSDPITYRAVRLGGVKDQSYKGSDGTVVGYRRYEIDGHLKDGLHYDERGNATIANDVYKIASPWVSEQ